MNRALLAVLAAAALAGPHADALPTPRARWRDGEAPSGNPLTYDDLQRIDRANEKRSRKAAARLARRAS